MGNTFDRTKETALTMGELAHEIKKKWGDEWTPRTLSLWITIGRVRRSDKEVIQMDGMQLGGNLHSSIEAYERFIEELNL